MILLNNFRRQWDDTREAAMAAFAEIAASGSYILGREVREFEEALARYWGMAEAVGVASGLDAIEISLKTLGCHAGDKVLTTPLSAFASTLAIVKLGAVPVFVDTDAHGLIDLNACRAVLTSRRDIHFLLPVHLYGHALDRKQLAAIRDEFGIFIVEDCAQSVGASQDGNPTGSAGHMAATSFYPTKNLGAMGDGGAILTQSSAYAATARTLRNYGQSAKYRHDVLGYNSRLDEIQAGLMRRVSLSRLPGWTDKRRRIASLYKAELRNPAIRVVDAPAACMSSWHLFPVLVDPERKPDFMQWLRSRGIDCGEHYPLAIPDQRALSGVAFEVEGSLETAQRICRSEVSLPIHPYITEAEIERVIEACNLWKG